jgi:hypothetical protein
MPSRQQWRKPRVPTSRVYSRGATQKLIMIAIDANKATVEKAKSANKYSSEQGSTQLIVIAIV